LIVAALVTLTFIAIAWHCSRAPYKSIGYWHPNDEQRPWTQREIDLLGTARDVDVARLIAAG